MFDLSDISIIITVSNGAKYIENAIESILKSDAKIKEIIVVDDGSIDKTPDILRKYSEKGLIKNHKIEKSGKLNAIKQGLKFIKSEVVILTDDDMIFKQNTISSLVKPLQDSNIDGVSGLVIPVLDKNEKNPLVLSQTCEHLINFFERRFCYSRNKNSLFSGSLIALKTNALKSAISGITNSVCEDYEIALKLIYNKAKIIAEKRAIAFHARIPSTIGSFIRQKTRWHGGLMQGSIKGFFPLSFAKLGIIINIVFYPFIVRVFTLFLLMFTLATGEYSYILMWVLFLMFLRIFYNGFLLKYFTNRINISAILADVLIAPLRECIAFLAQSFVLFGVKISWHNTRVKCNE